MRLVRLENGDGGGDDISLRFYVAITIPQIPLSEINGVVNQFFREEGKRERSNFWFMLAALLGTGISFLPKIKFPHGQIATSSGVW